MKKIFSGGLAATILMLTIATVANSQLASTDLPRSKDRVFDNSVPANYSSEIDRTQVNARALKSFMKSYSSITNERWFRASDGFVAKFSVNSIDCRADYDLKGNWLHSFRTYDESKLPGEVRQLVKSNYYDYAIRQVLEIETNARSLSYIILLDGEKEFIYLKVRDGEMEEWQKLTKSK